MPNLFGSGSAVKKQQEAQQRKSLADLARQQGEIDQASAAARPGRRGGRGLLTFLSGDGQSTFG